MRNGVPLLTNRAFQRTNLAGFSIEDFLNVPFTHHYYILTKSDDLAEILFYIRLCSQMHYSGDELKRSIQENDYHHQSTMPNVSSRIDDFVIVLHLMNTIVNL